MSSMDIAGGGIRREIGKKYTLPLLERKGSRADGTCLEKYVKRSDFGENIYER